MLGRAERHDLAVSLLLTDIDHFKKVNDTYGHPTGDEVLRRVAAILKASARKIDIVARYGGEEFAIVLEGDRPRRARASWPSASARRSSSRASRRRKGPFKATLSIGVATYPDDAREKADIIARADQALYAAKHGGRNRTVLLRRHRPGQAQGRQVDSEAADSDAGGESHWARLPVK